MQQKTIEFWANIPAVPQLWVLYKKLKAMPGYYHNIYTYKQLVKKTGDKRFQISSSHLSPQLLDKTQNHNIEPHYTYHPAWAARILAETKPAEHIDIGSTLNFCTITSAFIPIRFYDYRPAALTLPNLKTSHTDLTNLPFNDNSVYSLSCMHTIEHIGLGRYGDPIDPEGDKKAAAELARVLKPGGQLIIVTPVGYPHLIFNAHRFYSYQMVLNLFPTLSLKEFSLIPDKHDGIGFIKNADPTTVNQQKNGCGCFVFTKK